ncbi:hypothetical protein NMY22_g12650 [Coprinellus aureogranulatus]|nr:hypothetical protein NMY22_g12650 [Coprinellus aureogranulatus]
MPQTQMIMSMIHHSPGPYTDYRYSQFFNGEDLIIYSELAGALIRIPWPLADNDERVDPEDMFDWLRDHDVYWPCFCVDRDRMASSKFVVKPDGAVLALCNSNPSVCAFELNLTKIHKLTTIEARFPHLKPQHRVWGVGEFEEVMKPYLYVFQHSQDYHSEILGEDTTEDPLIFWGYCGDSDLQLEQEGCEWEDGMHTTWFDRYSRASLL